MDDLLSKKCIPCEGGTAPLTSEQIAPLLEKISGWKLSPDSKTIWKDFLFTGFADGMAFANKIAILADEEGHHPNLTVSWAKVYVELSTHSIGGLSENDFILAAKIDQLSSACV
jgi:4a-hydroxytetrahydrobiopterin dehydratase